MMPTTASVASSGAKLHRRRREQRERKPQQAMHVPIFNRTPARMTETGVGASTCASGNQRVEREQRDLDGKRQREGEEQPELSRPGNRELVELQQVE
jgi:hypothetical protein